MANWLYVTVGNRTIVQHNELDAFARQLAKLACSDLNILPETPSSATVPASRHGLGLLVL